MPPSVLRPVNEEGPDEDRERGVAAVPHSAGDVFHLGVLAAKMARGSRRQKISLRMWSGIGSRRIIVWLEDGLQFVGVW